jgi:DNA-binding transcriptional ArsR family regulator
LKEARVASANRRFKDAIYEQFARIGKALASPKRLELLDLLCQGPRTVDALAREAGMSTASASQHLQVLRAARLLEAGKEGPFVRYRLADDAVVAYLSMRDQGDRPPSRPDPRRERRVSSLWTGGYCAAGFAKGR